MVKCNTGERGSSALCQAEHLFHSLWNRYFGEEN